MITLKIILRPDWMCKTPHCNLNKRFLTICIWFIDLNIQWSER